MNLNDKIKSALQTSVPNWDDEALWALIEPNLPPKKDRRRIMFFWASAVACASAGILYLMHPSYSKYGAPQRDAAVEMPTENTSRGNNDPRSLGATPSLLAPDKWPATSTVHWATAPIIGQSRMAPLPYPGGSQNTDQVLTIPLIAPSISDIPTTNTALEKPISGIDGRQNTAANRQENLVPDQLPNRFLPIPLQWTLRAAPSDVPVLPQPPLLSTTVAKKPFFDLTVTMGIYATTRSTKAQKAEKVPYANFKRTHEKPVETITGQILLNKTWRNKWTLGVGLQWEQITEWYKETEKSTTIVPVFRDSATFYIVNGQYFYQPGERKITTVTERIIESPNTLQRVFIPIQVSYNVKIRHQNVAVYGGFRYNVFNQYQGIVRDENLNVVDKQATILRSIYRKNGVHSLFFGTQTAFQLNPHWGVQLGLQYHADLVSALQKEVGIAQKYQQIGVNLGVRYRVTGKGR